MKTIASRARRETEVCPRTARPDHRPLQRLFAWLRASRAPCPTGDVSDLSEALLRDIGLRREQPGLPVDPWAYLR